MKNVMLFFFTVLFAITGLSGQGSNLPLGNDAYHVLDRLEIKTGLPAPFHSTLKYYTRGAVTQYALQIDTLSTPLSSKDRRDLYYIFKDNNEWLATAPAPTTISGPRVQASPDMQLTQVEASMMDDHYIQSRKPVLRVFYRTPANLLEVNEKYVHLRINPILLFSMAGSSGDDTRVFYNLRGAEVRGGVDDRIYFYANLLETQAQFPDYVEERIRRDNAIPGQGLFKPYTSDIFGVENGRDFLNGQGYFGLNISRHVGMQFGYGRNSIGNGYRSILLSDFSNNYLYLKFNWKVWKLHYQNLFAELSADAVTSDVDEPLAKKYMAVHHLSFDITPQFNVGLFEAVVFTRNNQFELQYLNPFMFYRTVEQSLGSSDNALLGLDGKWNFLNHFQLYGQFLLDEFAFNELFRERRGWWGNKFGYQAGLKYIDAFGIDHLDLQLEQNTVRPYTFTHRDSSASYTHYNQPLAHPLGANFRESLFRLRYQPLKNLVVEARYIHATSGDDTDTTNWGTNLLLPNLNREQDYNNEIGQGIRATTNLIGIDLSYQVFHNVFLDVYYFRRKKNSDRPDLDNTTRFLGCGIRMNFGKVRWDF